MCFFISYVFISLTVSLFSFAAKAACGALKDEKPILSFRFSKARAEAYCTRVALGLRMCW